MNGGSMGGKQRLRKVSAADARRLLTKAEEFVDAARADLDATRFTACGLAAVHAGISAADAVTASADAVVSSAPDHLEVVKLLRRSLRDGLPTHNERQLVGLLKVKNEIEYSGQMLTQAKAKTLLDQATRFVAWSRSVIDEP